MEISFPFEPFISFPTRLFATMGLDEFAPKEPSSCWPCSLFTLSGSDVKAEHCLKTQLV